MIRNVEGAIQDRIHTRQPALAGVEQLAKQRLHASRHYSYYFSQVTIQYANGILTLRGQVPTQALKQLLDSLMAGIESVRDTRNCVEVISSTGLSSVHHDDRRKTRPR